MYNLDYQEDINVNAFFKILKRSKLYTNVERNCWLVCVPQTSSLAGLKITQDILGFYKKIIYLLLFILPLFLL